LGALAPVLAVCRAEQLHLEVSVFVRSGVVHALALDDAPEAPAHRSDELERRPVLAVERMGLDGDRVDARVAQAEAAGARDRLQVEPPADLVEARIGDVAAESRRDDRLEVEGATGVP